MPFSSHVGLISLENIYEFSILSTFLCYTHKQTQSRALTWHNFSTFRFKRDFFLMFLLLTRALYVLCTYESIIQYCLPKQSFSGFRISPITQNQVSGFNPIICFEPENRRKRKKLEKGLCWLGGLIQFIMVDPALKWNRGWERTKAYDRGQKWIFKNECSMFKIVSKSRNDRKFSSTKKKS